IDVDRDDLGLAGELPGECLELRGRHLAWPAPFSAKLDEHRELRAKDLGLERLFRDYLKRHERGVQPGVQRGNHGALAVNSGAVLLALLAGRFLVMPASRVVHQCRRLPARRGAQGGQAIGDQRVRFCRSRLARVSDTRTSAPTPRPIADQPPPDAPAMALPRFSGPGSMKCSKPSSERTCTAVAPSVAVTAPRAAARRVRSAAPDLPRAMPPTSA